MRVFFRRITLISFVKIQTTPYPFALPPRIIIWINFNIHFLERFSNKLKIVWPIGFWKEDLKIFFSLYSYVKIGPALCPHLTSGVKEIIAIYWNKFEIVFQCRDSKLFENGPGALKKKMKMLKISTTTTTTRGNGLSLVQMS